MCMKAMGGPRRSGPSDGGLIHSVSPKTHLFRMFRSLGPPDATHLRMLVWAWCRQLSYNQFELFGLLGWRGCSIFKHWCLTDFPEQTPSRSLRWVLRSCNAKFHSLIAPYKQVAAMSVAGALLTTLPLNSWGRWGRRDSGYKPENPLNLCWCFNQAIDWCFEVLKVPLVQKHKQWGSHVSTIATLHLVHLGHSL